MNNILTINYRDRKVEINLWNNNYCLDRIDTEESLDIIQSIDAILKLNNLTLNSLDKIGFLSGPGSFTSARVVAATCAGIQTAFKSILIVPVLLNQAIHSLHDYASTDILLKCNNHTWHLYQDEKWLLLPNSTVAQYLTKPYITPNEIPQGISCQPALEWPDINLGLAKFTWSQLDQIDINPYYGFEFPIN